MHSAVAFGIRAMVALIGWTRWVSLVIAVSLHCVNGGECTLLDVQLESAGNSATILVSAQSELVKQGTMLQQNRMKLFFHS